MVDFPLAPGCGRERREIVIKCVFKKNALYIIIL